MMERLLIVKDIVGAVLHDETITNRIDKNDLNLGLTNEEYVVLEPIVQVTDLLNKEDIPTLSQIVILLSEVMCIFSSPD